MQVISFTVMYAVMYANVASIEHVYLNLNRVYMALLMVSPMTAMMVLMMKEMYQDKKMNQVVIAITITVFTLALIGLRTQAFINDEQYMLGMIPHHSSAILTSNQATIKDPAVKNLSQQIINTQIREIELMKELLTD